MFFEWILGGCELSMIYGVMGVCLTESLFESYVLWWQDGMVFVGC